jgi:hypothetical protein
MQRSTCRRDITLHHAEEHRWDRYYSASCTGKQVDIILHNAEERR